MSEELREKVIKGLELCLQGDSNFCELSCPYYQLCGAFYENNEALLKDALALLKAYEPGWISVKERLPDEHDSIFAGRAQLSKYLWSKESDNVNVYVEFPDGTGRVTEGRLQDGKWWTRISPVLNPVVTHWKPLPEPPKEGT